MVDGLSLNFGFIKSPKSTLYVKMIGGQMFQVFEITNLDLMLFFLGNRDTTRKIRSLYMSEKKYKRNIERVLHGEMKKHWYTNEQKKKNSPKIIESISFKNILIMIELVLLMKWKTY